LSEIITPRDLNRKQELRETVAQISKVVEAGDVAGLAAVVIMRNGNTLQVEDYRSLPIQLVIGALDFLKSKATRLLFALEDRAAANAPAPSPIVRAVPKPPIS
jgi:hypothetical protein